MVRFLLGIPSLALHDRHRRSLASRGSIWRTQLSMASNDRRAAEPTLIDDAGMHIIKDNLHAQAYYTIRSALMRGRFRPGQRLLLKPLADELGISVTPVREALLRLASEHGLAPGRSRTMIVPVLSVARFREIRDIRVELEGRAAAASALRVTSEDLAKLHAIHQEMLLSRANRDTPKALSLNLSFHFTIYALADLPVLGSLIEGLWVRIGPLLTCLYDHVEPKVPSVHPHDSILAALANGDGSAARLAVANDIMWASAYLEKAVVAMAGEPSST